MFGNSIVLRNHLVAVPTQCKVNQRLNDHNGIRSRYTGWHFDETVVALRVNACDRQIHESAGKGECWVDVQEAGHALWRHEHCQIKHDGERSRIKGNSVTE